MLKGRGKAVWIGVLAMLVVLGSAMTAQAASSIDKIKVTFKNNYASDGGEILEPTVTVGGSGYSVEDISWSKDLTDWKPGTKITATVTLVAEEGKEFRSSYKSSKATVSGADYISAKRQYEDGSVLLKASYYPVVQLGETEKAGWGDTNKTRAVWKKVPYATAYQLKLYRGNDDHVKTLTLEGTNVDLSEYITKEANYFYEVMATSKDSSDANYRKNGQYVTSEDSFMENLGETGGHWSKQKNGNRYTDENGVAAVNGWRYILGTWYYFNESGYAVTGWNLIGDKWYYLNSEAKMQTGWLDQNGTWYYLDSTGAMVTGWQQLSPSIWYYFYEDGKMAANTVIEGYTLGSDGKMQ